MAQAWRSASHYYSADTVSARVTTEPAGAAQGDVLVMIILCNQSSMTLGLPSGWTALDAANVANLGYATGYIIRGASAPSYTFTVGTVNSRTPECFVHAFSGCDGTTPIAGHAVGSESSQSVGHNCQPPNLDFGTNALGLICASRINGYGTGAVTGNWAIQGANAGGQIGVCAVGTVLMSGTTTPSAFTGQSSGTAEVWEGATIALAAPAAAGVTARGYNLQQAVRRSAYY